MQKSIYLHHFVSVYNVSCICWLERLFKHQDVLARSEARAQANAQANAQASATTSHRCVLTPCVAFFPTVVLENPYKFDYI